MSIYICIHKNLKVTPIYACIIWIYSVIEGVELGWILNDIEKWSNIHAVWHQHIQKKMNKFYQKYTDNPLATLKSLQRYYLLPLGQNPFFINPKNCQPIKNTTYKLSMD